MVLVTKKKRPTSAHHKRRQGQHHSHDTGYHKAYWPYLPIALIVGLGFVVNAFWGNIQQHVLSYATDMSIGSLLQETNEERRAAGLGSLTLNTQLNQAAQAKADDMAARNYWSHNTPNGDPPWVFFTNAGYKYQTAGENLAYGFATSTDTVIGWMNSPGHKANIVNTSYKEIGFGIANSPDYQGTGPETIVVAMYASPQVLAAAPAPQPAAPPKSQPAPAPTPAPTPAPEPAPAPQEETNATPEVAEPTKAVPATVAPQKVARLQLLAGSNAAWSMFAVSTIAIVSIVIFFLRHGMLWHRVLVKGEAFIHKHPFLDITLVALATVGIVLTQTDGIIR
jgi:Cysteine-rich secretory protein family